MFRVHLLLCVCTSCCGLLPLVKAICNISTLSFTGTVIHMSTITIATIPALLIDTATTAIKLDTAIAVATAGIARVDITCASTGKFDHDKTPRDSRLGLDLAACERCLKGVLRNLALGRRPH